MKELIINEENLQKIINKKYIKYNSIKNKIKILIKINILTINLPELLILDCSYNYLEELNINNLINLQKLYCSYNELRDLNINNLTKLEYLNCSGNYLKDLNINNLINLEFLYCENNNLNYLNINNLSNLYSFSINNNIPIICDNPNKYIKNKFKNIISYVDYLKEYEIDKYNKIYNKCNNLLNDLLKN